MTEDLRSAHSRLLNGEGLRVWWGYLKRNVLLVTFAALFAIFTLSSQYFATSNNLIIILTQLTPLGIVVVGQTLVIITGGIDLSVGSVAAFTSIIAANLMLAEGGAELPPLIAIAMALMAATAIGWVQGWLIARQDLPPFVVTFGSLSLIKGIALVSSDAAPISIPRELSHAIWQMGSALRPLPILLLLVIAGTMSYVLRNTKLGRYSFAIGSNETVTRISGVRVDYYKIQVYMISSALAGLAGILLMTRIGSGVYTIAEDYGLLSVAAAVIGGTSLRGGVGNIRGPLLGTLIIVMIDSNLGLFQISPLWSTAIIGGFILLATLADRIRQRAQNAVPQVYLGEVQGQSPYYAQIRTRLGALVKQQTACEHIRLYMVDRQTDWLVEQGHETDDRTIVDRPNHIAKHVVEKRQPVIVDNASDERALSITPIHPDLDFQSAIALPIMVEHRVIGVLELQSAYGNVFTEKFAADLLDITQQIARPLENAWLLESGWLLRNTRDALRHLWDEVYLGKSNLADWLYSLNEIPQVSIAARGLKIQQLLIKIVQVIRDKESLQRSSDGKSRYDILNWTYIQGLSTDEIIEKLFVSRRQYYYDLKDALEVVAHLLTDQDLSVIIEET